MTHATNQHYDQAPEIFEVFLDSRMKYTAGLYVDGGETLDEAQESKLHYIARLLKLRGGERVLDIGSGWGSMALFLSGELGCQVTGVTPSPRQAAYINQRATDRVNVRVGGFEDAEIPGGANFDAIAAVGVLEHMVDQSAAVAKMRTLLRQGGRLYLSASCYRSNADKAEYESRPASRHAVGIFGHTVMPSLSSLVRSVEDAGLSLTSLTDLTDDYRRTISEWRKRIAEDWARMEAITPGFAAEIDRYFEAANASWGYTAKHYALTAINARMGELNVAVP